MNIKALILAAVLIPMFLGYTVVANEENENQLVSTENENQEVSAEDENQSDNEEDENQAASAEDENQEVSAETEGDDEEDSELKKVVGLAIVVDFPDQRAIHTIKEVDELFNRIGGIGGDSPSGSVFDYYYEISGGRLEHTNIVVPSIITMPREKTYYDVADSTLKGERRQEFITDILNAVDTMDLDLSSVARNESNRVIALSIFYAGRRAHGWSEGLWPHAGSYRGKATARGLNFRRYQITDMGTSQSLSGRLSTLVHEIGHMLLRWPDLYQSPKDTATNTFTVGRWCVMAAPTAPYLMRPTFFSDTLPDGLTLRTLLTLRPEKDFP